MESERKRLGWTKAHAAAQLRITRQHYDRIIKGEQLEYRMMAAIDQVFGLKLDLKQAQWPEKE